MGDCNGRQEFLGSATCNGRLSANAPELATVKSALELSALLAQGNCRGDFTPVKEVYRAMRPDLRDLQYAYHPAMGEDPELETMRIFVARAVTHGSRERSPFLHASKSINKSRRFAKLGINLRGETGNLFCRIRIYDMLCDGCLQPGDVIDVSSTAAVKEFFNKKTWRLRCVVRGQLSAMCPSCNPGAGGTHKMARSPSP